MEYNVLMLILIVILVLMLVTLVIVCYKITKAAIRVSQQNQNWESFYDNSLEDVESVITMLDTLMNKRQLVSDDPDVQNTYRVVVILHDILAGYINAKTASGTEKGKEE